MLALTKTMRLAALTTVVPKKSTVLAIGDPMTAVFMTAQTIPTRDARSTALLLQHQMEELPALLPLEPCHAQLEAAFNLRTVFKGGVLMESAR